MCLFDPASGRQYYWEKATNTTTYEKPAATKESQVIIIKHRPLIALFAGWGCMYVRQASCYQHSVASSVSASLHRAPPARTSTCQPALALSLRAMCALCQQQNI
eukprot:GHUV01054832.1.p2 GENE.GHUV01054832.1~~GHUV01054832.1.p2  ORF type:complete len:104 (-),score=0.59 GHUV01054832.1:238-549(-)